MSVFRNYNNKQAGGVNANAFPRVHPIPWFPTQRNIRANPSIPSQPQRIQPHERGTFFPTSASGSGTLAPSSADGCSCGGDCGGGSTGADIPSASELLTRSTFSGTLSTSAPKIMRPQPRIVGALRPSIRAGSPPLNLGVRSRM